jgi:hypothetical protein
LVSREPIEIEISGTSFPRGKNGFLGVIQCGEFEYVVHLPRNLIGRSSTNRN